MLCPFCNQSVKRKSRSCPTCYALLKQDDDFAHSKESKREKNVHSSVPGSSASFDYPVEEEDTWVKTVPMPAPASCATSVYLEEEDEPWEEMPHSSAAASHAPSDYREEEESIWEKNVPTSAPASRAPSVYLEVEESNWEKFANYWNTLSTVAQVITIIMSLLGVGTGVKYIATPADKPDTSDKPLTHVEEVNRINEENRKMLWGDDHRSPSPHRPGNPMRKKPKIGTVDYNGGFPKVTVPNPSAEVNSSAGPQPIGHNPNRNKRY
ncbi:MAG: hypothetical protein GY765_36905 [bacterium]|nr:hypothetical protein [bacterium]